MDIEKTCAFTGHRVIRDIIDGEQLERIVTEYIDGGYDTFLCGMAIGFDMLAAELILKIKETRNIKLVACVPCPAQEKYFSPEDKKRYGEIIARCDEVRVLNDHYYRGCMQMRDRYMVDNASLVIAYRRVNEGGTHYTVKYAAENGKKICFI